jgi:hypothetical protein
MQLSSIVSVIAAVIVSVNTLPYDGQALGIAAASGVFAEVPALPVWLALKYKHHHDCMGLKETDCTAHKYCEWAPGGVSTADNDAKDVPAGAPFSCVYNEDQHNGKSALL